MAKSTIRTTRSGSRSTRFPCPFTVRFSPDAVGVGRQNGETTLGDIVVTKTWDSSTPKLAAYCCSGKFLDTVTIHLCSDLGGKNVVNMELKLSNVVISSYSFSATGDQSPRALGGHHAQLHQDRMEVQQVRRDGQLGGQRSGQLRFGSEPGHRQLTASPGMGRFARSSGRQRSAEPGAICSGRSWSCGAMHGSTLADRFSSRHRGGCLRGIPNTTARLTAAVVVNGRLCQGILRAVCKQVAPCALKQDPHRLEVTTPLGQDKLLLTSFQGTEEFSRPFHFGLTMVSEDPSIDPKSIVGKNVTVKLKYPGERRTVLQRHRRRVSPTRAPATATAPIAPRSCPRSGCSPARPIAAFSRTRTSPRSSRRSSASSASPTTSSRRPSPIPQREYCVQYRETAFNFVSRLMEQYGIFYFFKHEDGKHTLVLGDDVSAYVDCKEKDVSFRRNMPGNVDLISSWEHQFEYRPGKWTHTDYNFKTPKTDLKTDTDDDRRSARQQERGRSSTIRASTPRSRKARPWSASAWKKTRCRYDVVSGGGICRSFSPGGKFTMKEHVSPGEAGKKYVITSVTHFASGPEYTTGRAPARTIYQNTFTCVPDSVVLRPARLTPKPVIHGSQTAVVVGPPGEEIYPDKYGRVKVQFFWDREGKKDDKSSCWIRCMVPSAGRNWGFMSIPRIGQEVVVSYLEGDPDRPLITGQVYNADQMPAYTLPDEKTKSYLKTNSSKGGEGHNELRFEDKQGSEQVYIHAEKDMDCRVKNDSREQIVGNRHQIDRRRTAARRRPAGTDLQGQAPQGQRQPDRADRRQLQDDGRQRRGQRRRQPRHRRREEGGPQRRRKAACT